MPPSRLLVRVSLALGLILSFAVLGTASADRGSNERQRDTIADRSPSVTAPETPASSEAR